MCDSSAGQWGEIAAVIALHDSRLSSNSDDICFFLEQPAGDVMEYTRKQAGE